MVKFRTADGQRLVYPPGDDVATFLNAGWYEFRELGFFYRFLRKGDRFLDIGAHCGLYSAIARPIVGKQGYVLAIEPGADLAEYLKQNLDVPGPVEDARNLTGEGCEWLRAAVMDEPGVVYLSGEAIEKSAYRDVHAGGDAGSAVPAVTGDQITGHLGKGFDLIKIDVEGAEISVLSGLLQTLQQYPDTILMVEFTEANQSRHMASTQTLANHIQELGFGLHTFDDIACRLVPVTEKSGLEHTNLFACRNADAVNEKLQSTPSKQIQHADEVFQRGRASESLYFGLLFKNFRARGADWVGKIAGSLRYLRGTPKMLQKDGVLLPPKWKMLRLFRSKPGLLAIEDGLGQLEGTAAISDSLETERQEHAVLKRQFDEAEALIVQDMRLESPNLEIAIRGGMEALAADLLLLQEVALALPDTPESKLANRLNAYSGRLHRENAEALSNRIELQRLKPVMLAASEQLREARSRDVVLEAALAETQANLGATEAEVRELESSRQALNEQLSAARSNEAALAAALAEIQANFGATEAEVRELESSRQALNEQLSAARSNEAALEAALAETQSTLAGVKAELHDLSASKKISDDQLLAARANETALEVALNELRANYDVEVAGKLASAESRVAALELELAETRERLGGAEDSLQAEKLRFEEMLQETDRLLSQLNDEHRAELDDLRTAAADAKALSAYAEGNLAAALEEAATGKAQLADLAVIIGESARELSNLAYDASSDHDVIRDLVRSVRASRVATLAAIVGMGPRRATSQMMTQTAAARAKVSEILLKADFLKSVSKEAEARNVDGAEIDIVDVDNAWSVYGSAVEKYGRERRSAIGACARDDMRAIGQSVDALRRSRFMRLASMLGLQASRELDKLYEIYCARQND